MIICVGLVVDVGHAMLVQRQLQAGVDAAALAGVQHLPDAPMAEAVAVQYSATPGKQERGEYGEQRRSRPRRSRALPVFQAAAGATEASTESS